MRFTLSTLPFWVLFCLPFFVAYKGYGLFFTLILMILWFGVHFGVVTYYQLNQGKDKRFVLNTLPISHYVEKTRWCLEKSGLQFEEEKDIGIFGKLFLGRGVPVLNVPGKKISISNSSDILRYVYAIQVAKDPAKAKFLEPSPETIAWEKKIDKMGEDLRRYVYYHALKSSKNPDEFAFRAWGMEEEEIPAWQKTLLKIVCPILKAALSKLINITPEGANDGFAKSEVLFKEVDEVLKGGQNYILGTDEPTYVDFAFASLAAILALPENYGGPGLNPRTRISFSSDAPLMGSEFQKAVVKFRKTPSGKFVLRMYSEHR